MRQAWKLSLDAAQGRQLFFQRGGSCFHKSPANSNKTAYSRCIHESASQNQSASSPQFTWPNISAFFLNKLTSTEDSAAKRDQMDRVCALKDELFDCSGNMAGVERVLEEKGVPLFRRYYDGSAVVELLKQLDSSPDLAFQVFNWRREQMDCGAPMTTEEYAKGINVAGKLKDTDLAEELFAEAANKKLKETSLYNALMGAYMYNGLAAKCQLVFRDLKQEATCRPTIVSYNILISVFGRLMLIDHMEAILQEIKAVNISPNLSTYNYLISGYITAWMWDNMEKTYMIMKADGVEPNLTSHLLMLRGYAHSGGLEKMEEMYELVKDHVNSKEIFLIRAMIHAYCKNSVSNRVEKVEKLLMLVPENEYKPWLNIFLICLYANEDLFEAMENSISKAFENNIVVRTTGIMRCIASSYFRQNEVVKLADFVKRAEFAGWKICRSLYHCKMVMYSAERRLADMERVIDEMEQVNLYISKKTFWILYKAYTRWGEKSKLEALVGMMCKCSLLLFTIITKESIILHCIKTPQNPFKEILTSLPKAEGGGEFGKFYSLPALNDARIGILLESAIRNCDNFQVTKNDVEKIIDWENTSPKQVEIPFKPARVLLQDFTGVPAVVDLASMRDAIKDLHGDPDKINPLVPVDLVIDHSVQVDVARQENAVQANMDHEFRRNNERFAFLKWGSTAFRNMLVVPPGSGIVHQVNLEYLGRVVFNTDGILYPDSVVGTDSHTTMIDGLGVAGWGVGGIEAEAAMLGQPMSMVLPGVVGFKLSGKLRNGVTATDLVLTVTQMLRKHGVVGKFVEFYGPGMAELSLADRATIANMSPEYGATMGFFPVDHVTLQYLKLTGRSDDTVAMIEGYLRANKMFIDYSEPQTEKVYSSCLELDLTDVLPCVSGPKRPHDRVPIKDMKNDWHSCLDNNIGFKGFGIPKEEQTKVVKFSFNGEPAELKHGSVVIAAITSCTNTSNPSVMLGAGLVAKKACELGLEVKPWIKTSLAPGSGVVTKYLLQSGLQKYLNQQGFNIVGYGCTTCIGNSGDLHDSVASAISENDLVAAAVLSGNRNFEGRVHPLTRANYLASPPLVVAYALAGTVDIDFEKEPLGTGKDGRGVFFKDVWPTNEEIAEVVQSCVLPEMFKSTYEAITKGNPFWNQLSVPSSNLYAWDPNSTYIHQPPYFKNMTMHPPGAHGVKDAYCLLNFGDSITTDHISPAGSIHKDSPAAKFLMEKGVDRKDFNSYGSRRGNDEVMTRGTFANIRLFNKFIGKQAPLTIHIPTGDKLSVYDAAMRYKNAGQDTIILAGAEYGSGSSRDWAAKGPMLQGVKAVIAKSFERIHRSNLVGMGIIPLCFKPGEDADTLGLTGYERYSIDLPEKVSDITPGQDITVTTDKGKSFTCILRFDTQVELTYFDHGGILQYVIRNLIK